MRLGVVGVVGCSSSLRNICITLGEVYDICPAIKQFILVIMRAVDGSMHVNRQYDVYMKLLHYLHLSFTSARIKTFSLHFSFRVQKKIAL